MDESERNEQPGEPPAPEMPPAQAAPGTSAQPTTPWWAQSPAAGPGPEPTQPTPTPSAPGWGATPPVADVAPPRHWAPSEQQTPPPWSTQPTQPPIGPPPGWPTAPPPPPPVPPTGGWDAPGAAGWPGGPYGAPGAWPAAPPAPSGTKRVVAALAALMLVLASAGVGALIAVAVHHNSGSQTVTFPTFPNSGSNGTSNGSGTGTLDQNEIASKVTPAIVNINTTLAQGRAAGTGMVISSDGEVLTNNHVIADATSIKVDFGGKNTKTAHVVGYDVADDVALVKIDDVSNLKTINFGDPGKVNVGDPVVAIGNALGKGGSPAVTQGKITGLNQQVTAGDETGGVTETLRGMIQIDAPIQPGDSGGALVDANAGVIGMNTAAAGGRFRQQTGSNIGFAIPIDNAVSIIRQIQSGVETDRVHIGPRGLLGVSVRDIADANGSGATIAPVDSGAAVASVQAGSGAAAAGIQAGDVITSVDGKTIADLNALHSALTGFHPDESVKVGWVDTDGRQHTANVKLGVGPPA